MSQLQSATDVLTACYMEIELREMKSISGQASMTISLLWTDGSGIKMDA